MVANLSCSCININTSITHTKFFPPPINSTLYIKIGNVLGWSCSCKPQQPGREDHYIIYGKGLFVQVFYSRNLGHLSSVLVLLSLPASGGSHFFILHNASFQKHVISHASSLLLHLWRTQQQSRYWMVSDIYTLLNIGISFCLSWTCSKAKKKFLWTWCLHIKKKKKRKH